MTELKGNYDYTPTGTEEKNQKLKDLIACLEAITAETIRDTPFTYSNDQEISRYIYIIQEAIKKIGATLKVAITVSNGGVWNIFKELDDVDLVIRINVNANQLDHDRERRQAILKATDAGELLPVPSVKKLEDIAELKSERDRLAAPRIERESYGEYHYLSSNQQLKKTQDYLRKDTIAFVGGNLTNVAFMLELGSTLEKFKAQVVFADLSNVMDWVGSYDDGAARNSYLQALNFLPFSEAAVVLHSRRAGLAGRSSIYSRLSMGIKDYARDTKLD